MNEKTKKHVREWQPSPSSGICLLLSLIILVFAAMLTWLLPQKIQSVEIVGSTIYSDKQILELCGTLEDKSFVLLNEAAIRDSVCGVLPYVKDVSLKLSFPRRLRVTVTEEAAEYCTVSGDIVYLMNSDLKVLQTFSSDDGVPLDSYTYLKLPEIASAELCKKISFADEGAFEYISETVKTIDSSDFTGVKDIDLTGKLTMHFIYEGRVRIILGSAEELDTKLSFAYKTYTEKVLPLEEDRTAKIDVSKLPNSTFAPDAELPAIR